MKNILIISFSYPPYNAPGAMRPYIFSKYLDKSKYNITVLTYNYYEKFYGVDRDFDENLDGVNLIRLGKKSDINLLNRNRFKKNNLKSYLPNFLLIILRKITVFFSEVFINFPDLTKDWEKDALEYLANNNFNYDYIFSTSPMISNHLIAHKIKTIYPKVKWIADFRDFHYIFFLEYKWFNFRHKSIERKIIKFSDNLIFISEQMREKYEQRYVKYKNKMNVVYNSFDYNYLKTNNLNTNSGKVLRIFYAGNFYNGRRSPYHLIQTLEELYKKNKIKINDFSIQIAGNIDNEIKNKIESFEISSNIRFLGILPKSDVIKIMRNSDLLWIIVANEISHHTGVPIKFFEYMYSKKPILAFAPYHSEVASIIKNYNLGWNICNKHFNIEESKAILNKIFIEHKRDSLKLDLNYQYVDKKFLSQFQIKQFESILQKTK